MHSEEIECYLVALDTALASRRLNKPVKVVLVGGVYMVVELASRTSTRDIDFVPLDFPDSLEDRNHPQTKAFVAAIRTVAKQHQLPREWMNDAASPFIPSIKDPILWRQYPSLHVFLPSMPCMLAIKLLSGRHGRDEDDIQALLTRLAIHTRTQAQAVVDQYAPTWWQEECCLDTTLDAIFGKL